MPHKHEKEGKRIPRIMKRSVKLSEDQRLEIKENKDNLSGRALARKYGVSRRLISFILYPEKLAENLQRRKENGGSMRYYDRERHRETMKVHRQHKKSLSEQGLLED